MRWRPGRPIGLCIAGVGALIVLVIVLPSELWWLFLGAALIFIGILICRR
ncbi:hypothetical protein SAMN02745823_00089 [Sporobacter termitidis DSM 10068]|uniref:Uncharacterized protein n=1 Tax=Sporobacter termitidis DSM 10068 TaxID=1123282 RepID=A0A1M5TGW0_9FIRM|nr:hypothetical protein SAMN02745823_00089 [Sporobacter termitidis DSM 10068]